MGLIYYVALFISLLKDLKNSKSIATQIFCMLLVIPTIQIGNHWYSGQYIVMIVLFLVALKMRTRYLGQYTSLYVAMCALVIFSYCVGFLINNAEASMISLLTSVVTLLKYPLIIGCSGLILLREDTKAIEKSFGTTLKIIVIVNLVAVIMQMLTPSIAAKIIDSFFYNDEALNQIDSLAQGGRYIRYTGIYNYPAILGSIMLICLIWFLFERNDKKWNKVYLSAILIIGISSMSKTFYLGCAVILALWPLINFNSRNLKSFLGAGVTLVIIAGTYMYQQEIYLKLKSINAYLAFYFSCIFDLNKSLSTRYDTAVGNTAPMLKMIKEHFIIGYGPISVKGEVIQDSAFMVIAHNGGIIAIILIFVFYAHLLINKCRLKKKRELVLLMGFFMLGWALPVWIFSPVTLGLIVYLNVLSDKSICDVWG
jgi:hypothetical protein